MVLAYQIEVESAHDRLGGELLVEHAFELAADEGRALVRQRADVVNVQHCLQAVPPLAQLAAELRDVLEVDDDRAAGVQAERLLVGGDEEDFVGRRAVPLAKLFGVNSPLLSCTSAEIASWT